MYYINLPAPADLRLLASIPLLEIEFTSRSGGDAGSPCSESSKGRLRLIRKPRQRVLVVDDESVVADTVADVLNRDGYQAVPTYGGKEALRAARAVCPNIILIDVLMPDLNGVEAARALQRACPATRIILFSEQAGSSQLVECARAQGHQFEVLPKPIHPRELLCKLTPKQ